MNCAVPPIKSYDVMDIYDRVIAYLVDMEARAGIFKNNYASAPVHEFNLEDIATKEGANLLFRALDIDFEVKEQDLLSIGKNSRTIVKQTIDHPVTAEYCVERLHSYLNRAKSLNLQIPERLLQYAA
jgi:hypothetical protein